MQDQNHVVLISDLPEHVTSQNLYELFSKAGEVIRILVGRDSLTGSTTGTAGCLFKSHEDANNVVGMFNAKSLVRSMSFKMDPVPLGMADIQWNL